MRLVFVGLVATLASCSTASERGAEHDRLQLASPRATALLASPRAAALLARASTSSASRFALGGLSVSLPESSAAPLVLSDARTGVRAEVFAEVARRDVPVLRQGAARVLADASPGVDVVHLTSGGAIEELRVLRDARGSNVLRWRVRTTADLRVRDGRVELVDRDGRVAIASAPMWAEDARGEVRDVRVRVERAGEDFRVEATFDDRELVLPIVVDPAWSNGPTMTHARQQFAVAPLSATKTLVVGGYDDVAPLSTCEIYDAATNTFTATGSMSIPRARISLTRLGDGRILVAGGDSVGVRSNTAEVYSPSTGKWTVTGGTLQYGRYDVGLVTLATGKALAVGGYPYGPGAYCDLYDPIGNSWSPAGSMNFERGTPLVQLLPTGKVLVAGGWMHGPVLSTAELYDPATDKWTATGSMSEPRQQPASAVLASGKVFVLGGNGLDSLSSSSELYDPTTGAWTRGPLATASRAMASSGLLDSGRVLVAGGTGGATAVLYDPTTNVLLPTTPLLGARDRGAIIPLSGGRALLVGGTVYSTLSSSELYAPAANGGACTTTGECGSGFCVGGVCCNSACTGYVCTGGTCATSCTTEAQCATGYFCSAGVCTPRKAASAGQTCGRHAECASGWCVDNYCCDSACDGQCGACDVAGSLGTCKPVTGAPHGARPACGGAGAGTVCGKSCNGTTLASCTFAGSATPCGANACTGGVETHQSLCDGAGSCPDVGTSCGAYACDATACRSSCTSSAQCATGHYCASGACLPKLELGKECASAATCGTGFCTDGVCCEVETCGGGGSSCAVAGKLGRCQKTQGTACGKDDECGSGRCVDGYCCESSCAGQCEACDVAGRWGRCVAIAGAPHGARPACDAGGGDACKARSCDGAKDRTACLGYRNGPAVSCADAVCTGSSFEPAKSCDGAGGCRAFAAISCAPYACDAKGCKTRCDAPEDCATGFACDAGACVPKAECTKDGLGSIGKDGARTDCLPYRCDAATGACTSTCKSSSECLAGYACDVTSGTCLATTLPTEDDGGGCAVGRTRSTLGAWLVLLGIVTFAARRRLYLGAAVSLLLGCRAEPRAAERTADGVVSSLRRWPHLALPAPQRGQAVVDLDAPARASGALRIALHDRPGAAIELLPEHGLDVPVERVDGGVVYRDVAPSTDLVVLADGATVEELRVLRDANAPTSGSTKIHRGPEIASIRLREGRIEAVGHDDRVALVAAPPYAVDAHGVRRLLSIALRDDTLTFSLDPRGLVHPIVVDPAWSASAPMSTARHLHTSLTLSDGRVLVAGGWDGGAYLSSAEIYDPKTNTWSTTGSLPSARVTPSMLQLSTGKVLLAGGTGADLRGLLWNPSTGAWSPTLNSAKIWRDGAHLLPLSATRALLVGGNDDLLTDLYDVTKNEFNTAVDPANLLYSHRYSVAAALSTGPYKGGALVVGGGGGAYKIAEIYDPATNAWKLAAPPLAGHSGAVSFVMPDGRVVVATDGSVPGASGATEIYDPVSNTWAAAPSMPGPRYYAAAAPLGFGRFLVTGGQFSYVVGTSTLSSAAIWDSATTTWRVAPSMSIPRTLHSAASFAAAGVTGAYEVLITGGLGIPSVVLTVASTERFTLLSNGDACTSAGECASNICATSLCCASACAPPYRCNGGTCPTACKSDADCSAGNYCSATVCVPKKANGGACAAGRECASTFCVDAVCCNTACTDAAGALLQCAACNLGGKAGTCSAVTGAPVSGRAACFGAGLGTTCGPSCNGIDTTRCVSAATTVACSSTGCSGGVETHLSKCDGKGKCLDVPNACGAYGCGAASCKTGCATSADCATGFQCSGGACVPVVGLGRSCTDASSCASGTFCTEGVCCAEASCGEGRTCAGDRKRGTCTKKVGVSCAANDECASSVCVDGVCCDSACTGQCQACDVPGSEGICSPVVGSPRGGRPVCGAAGPGLCQALVCDGAKDPEKCVAFAAGAAVECRPASCSSASFAAAVACDGAGSCPAATVRPCAPYGCDETGCKTACTSHGDCAKGNVCVEGKCAPEGSCTSDGLSTIGGDGATTSCAPFRCRSDGRCATECARTEDCAPGVLCDAAARRCVRADPTTDGGGCQAGHGPAGLWALTLLALSLGLVRRRA